MKKLRIIAHKIFFLKLSKIQITISVTIQMGASYSHTHTLGLLVAFLKKKMRLLHNFLNIFFMDKQGSMRSQNKHFHITPEV